MSNEHRPDTLKWHHIKDTQPEIGSHIVISWDNEDNEIMDDIFKKCFLNQPDFYWIYAKDFPFPKKRKLMIDSKEESEKFACDWLMSNDHRSDTIQLKDDEIKKFTKEILQKYMQPMLKEINDKFPNDFREVSAVAAGIASALIEVVEILERSKKN